METPAPASPCCTLEKLGPTLGLFALVLLLFWQLILSLEARTNLVRSTRQLEPAVGQSQQVQGGAMKLLNDLITLSENNANAKAVVQKYGIQRNANPSTQNPNEPTR